MVDHKGAHVSHLPMSPLSLTSVEMIWIKKRMNHTTWSPLCKSQSTLSVLIFLKASKQRCSKWGNILTAAVIIWTMIGFFLNKYNYVADISMFCWVLQSFTDFFNLKLTSSLKWLPLSGCISPRRYLSSPFPSSEACLPICAKESGYH